MGAGQFFKDVICAPYSIPMGIINYKVKTIGFCSTTSKKDLEIKDVTETNVEYSGTVGQQSSSGDVEISTEYKLLNIAIQDVLMEAKNAGTTSVLTDTNFQKNCLSVDDDPVYQRNLISNNSIKKINDNGEIQELPIFGCCSEHTIEQTTNINVVRFDEINDNQVDQIYNEIEAYIQTTLTEVGSETQSDTRSSILSKLISRSILKQHIRNEVLNITDQLVSVDMNVNYTDRYGRCDYDKDNQGWYVKGKNFKQTINIEVLSKQIIDSSISLIMRNINNMSSDTDVVIQRITNYRIIVVSILWNIIVIYILFKIFSLFLQAIN
jgi:hypothetical protein